METLRLVRNADQLQASTRRPIPAYTKDGFERVQKLKLTSDEAQFASQVNGGRFSATDCEEFKARFEICLGHCCSGFSHSKSWNAGSPPVRQNQTAELFSSGLRAPARPVLHPDCFGNGRS